MRTRKGRVQGLLDLGMCMNNPDGDGGGTTAGQQPKAEKPTLTWSQSVNRCREIESELTRLSELDTLTDDDEKYFRSLTEEFDVVDNHRKSLEREAELGRIRSAAGKIDARKGGRLSGAPVGVQPGAHTSDDYDVDAFLEPDSVESTRFRNPWDMRNVRTFGRSREDVNAELTSRARSAIDQMPQATDKVRSAATHILENYDDGDARIARMVLAASSPEYLRAFSKMATNKEYLLTADERRALDQVRAMSLTDAAGGYLVPFQLDPTVIVTANGSTNEIRQIARQVVATGDVWNGVTASAVSWSWDAEGSEVSDDTPTFASPAIPVYKAVGFVPISIEALEDANNVAGTVATLLAEGRDILESAAFVTGTGTGQPTGIITALVGSGSIVTSAAADTLAVGDLYATQGALPARYRANASWLANNLFYNRARQFDTGGGSALWAQLGDGRPANLLGRPIYEAEDMDGVINATQENYMAVFGDFRNYVIADRIGMTVEFIPHLFHTSNNRPSGQRGWYAYYRVGADSVNDAAFRMLNVT
jgi:HK97 family phage major capsid protein